MQLNKMRKFAAAQRRAAANSRATVAGSLMAAALALPGVVATPSAKAESVPEKTTVGIKYLSYSERQQTGERMKVKSPSIYVLAPIKDKYSIEASFVLDSVSGASPTAYNSLSGASGKGIGDYRKAGDVKVTRFFDRAAQSRGCDVRGDDTLRVCKRKLRLGKRHAMLRLIFCVF